MKTNFAVLCYFILTLLIACGGMEQGDSDETEGKSEQPVAPTPVELHRLTDSGEILSSTWIDHDKDIECLTGTYMIDNQTFTLRKFGTVCYFNDMAICMAFRVSGDGKRIGCNDRTNEVLNFWLNGVPVDPSFDVTFYLNPEAIQAEDGIRRYFLKLNEIRGYLLGHPFKLKREGRWFTGTWGLYQQTGDEIPISIMDNTTKKLVKAQCDEMRFTNQGILCDGVPAS